MGYRLSLGNYRPQRSWGKVICTQASVILLTGGVPAPGGGGCLLLGVGLLWGDACSGGGACSGGSAHGGVPGGDPPGRPLLRAVRILLECILVVFVVCQPVFLLLFEKAMVNDRFVSGFYPKLVLTMGIGMWAVKPLLYTQAL